MATDNKASAGDLLKQGRLRQRLSIAECTKRTHIASRYIEALEEGKWDALPSESHRLGFLRLYSRFLGVSADDILALYRQAMPPQEAPKQGASAQSPKPMQEPKTRIRTAPRTPSRWSPTSIPQLIGIAIILLVSSWVIYHTLRPRFFQQTQMPWARRRTPSPVARLIVPKTSASSHIVRIQARADSWLRVTSRNELLFEGILPAGSVKEWSGTGPFQLKLGNIRALALFWNSQPVDLSSGARGSTNQLRIPPQ